MDIVKLAIRNARLTISVLLFLILAGAVAYQSTPKEAEPDVPIPVMYVSLIYQGISPEDSERLLLRPMETKLKSLKGLKEMRSAAFQGGGYVLVEFQPSIDLATALQDTRSKVQDAKAELPQAAEEPTVTEVNISEFPVLVVTLSGNVPERVLTAAARELRDRIEEVPGVLEGTLQGARKDLVEVVVDPVKLSSYGLQLDQLIQGVVASNSLVAAGNIEGSQGKYAVKVPSLIETPEDIANLPVARHAHCRGSGQGRGDGALYLRGRGNGHPARRQACHRHRGEEAHRRQPDRHDRSSQGRVRQPTSRRCRKA